MERTPDGAELFAGVRGSVLFLRHGETEWNRRGRVMGHLPVPLNATGVAQCEAVLPLLRVAGIRRLVASPLARAQETAEIVARDLGLEITTDSGLSEVNFGAWAGRWYEELVECPDYQRYRENPVTNPPPDGETLLTVQQRGLAAVHRALVAADGASPILLVSHGDLIRSVLCHFLGADLARYRRLRLDNCSLSWAEIRGGRFRIRFVNVVADPVRQWSQAADAGERREL